MGRPANLAPFSTVTLSGGAFAIDSLKHLITLSPQLMARNVHLQARAPRR